MRQKRLVSMVSVFCRGVSLACLMVMLATPLLYGQEDLYEKALHAYQKQDFKAAVTYLKEYVARKPDARAYYLLGYANYKLKKRSEATEYFKEAYLIDPDFSPKGIDFKKRWK